MNIAIYPRKSVYRDNSDSVATQIKLCKEYAEVIYHGKDLNFMIYDEDEGFSGKNTDRPSFTKMMADVRSNLIDVVIVYKLDRISRNVQDFSATFAVLQKHNVAFVSVKESFDTSTPIGRTVMYILAAFAQLERENTAERVADSMRAMAASGYWTGGKLPTGMRSVTSKIGDKTHSYLVIDEDKIWLVKKLYSMFLSGMSICKVERECRDMGIKTQRGKFLSTSQIHFILHNPIYCQNSPEVYDYLKEKGCSLPEKSLFDGKHGLISYGKTKTQIVSQKRVPFEQWTIAIGIHDYVVTGEEWIAVQQRLNDNVQFYGNVKYEIGLLKGVLKCQCGCAFHNRIYIQNDNLFDYYVCSNRAKKGTAYCNAPNFRIHAIDNAFLNKLQEIRLNKDLIKISNRETINTNINTVEIKKEIVDIEKQIKNLTMALQENSSSAAAKYIIEQIEVLDKQHALLNSKLTTAKRVQFYQNQSQNEVDTVYNGICCLLDNFDNLSYHDKNEMIRKIVKRCVLNYDGSMDIEF